MAKIARHILSGGKLGARLQTRSDMEQYYTGAKRMENFIPTPQGGIRRRPGIAAVGEIGAIQLLLGTPPDTHTIDLAPQASRGFSLQSTDGKDFMVLLVHYSGEDPITGDIHTADRIEAWDLDGWTQVFQAESPYAASDYDDIQYLAVNDSLFLAHPDHPMQRLHREDADTWRFGAWEFDVPPALPVNGDPSKTVALGPSSWDSDMVYNVGDSVLPASSIAGNALWVGGAQAADYAFLPSGESFGLEEFYKSTYFHRERTGLYTHDEFKTFYPFIYLAVSETTGITIGDTIHFTIEDASGSWDGVADVLDIVDKTSAVGDDYHFLKLNLNASYGAKVSTKYTSEQACTPVITTSNLPHNVLAANPTDWFASDTRHAIEYSENKYSRFTDLPDDGRYPWAAIFGKDDPDDASQRVGGMAADVSGAIWLDSDASYDYYTCKQACQGEDTGNTDYWTGETGEPPPTTYYLARFAGTRDLTSDLEGRALFAKDSEEVYLKGEFSATGDVSDPIFAHGTVEFATEGGTWSGEIVLEVRYADSDDWTVIGTISSLHNSYNGSLERVIEHPGAQVRARMSEYTDGPCLWKIAIPDSGPAYYVIEKVYSQNTCLVSLRNGAAKYYQTWEWSLGAFGAVVGYPSALCIYEERLYLAGGPNPSTFYGSAINDWGNFALGATETSAVAFNIASDNLALIRWMTPFYGNFVIGTNVGVWAASNNSTTKTVISAVNPPTLKKVTPDGACSLVPAEVDGSLVFVTADRKTVKGISIDSYTTVFSSTDLTLLYPEVAGDSSISAMAVCRTPYPVVWFLLDNDDMRTLTINKAQGVLGWADHGTGIGTGFSLATMRRIDGNDVPYLVCVAEDVQTNDQFNKLFVGSLDGPCGKDTLAGLEFIYRSLFCPTSLAQDPKTLEEAVVRISETTLHYAQNDFPPTYLAPTESPADTDDYQREVDWESKQGPAFAICKLDTGPDRSPDLSISCVGMGDLELTALVVEISIKTSKGK